MLNYGRPQRRKPWSPFAIVVAVLIGWVILYLIALFVAIIVSVVLGGPMP